MALFGNDKPNWDSDEGDKLNFFSTSEADYKIPSSRKPVVVKKDKTTKKVTEKKRSTAKKAAKPAKKADSAKPAAKKSAAATTAVAKTAAKKAEDKKPAVKKAAATKAATKKTETKAATKKAAAKAETKKVEAKKPVAKAAQPKKSAAKAPATKKTATKAAAEIAEIEAVETVTEVRTAKNGSFDIKKSKDGRFVFNLYSANRVIIATSQVYSSSQSALTGIKSVMANAATAEIEDLTLKKPVPKAYPKWEIYIDRAGEYRFRLNASNANCICHAKAGYANKSNCKRGIDSIIRLADDADVKKQYLNKK